MGAFGEAELMSLRPIHQECLLVSADERIRKEGDLGFALFHHILQRGHIGIIFLHHRSGKRGFFC
jgi:hypothetical protein